MTRAMHRWWALAVISLAQLGVAAVMRDVTQRWTQQKQMRQRLADLEARAAAADLEGGGSG